MVKIVLLILLAVGLVVGGLAGWHEYQSKKSWDKAAEESGRKFQAEQGKWQGQLAALGRLRPSLTELDVRYPQGIKDTRACPATVRGDAFFFNRWRLKELMKPEDPPRSDLDDSDFMHVEKVPFWVVYTVESERATVVNADRTFVPGVDNGSVVVFDAKTHQPICHTPVSATSSPELSTRVPSDRSESAKVAYLREEGQRDLKMQFHEAVDRAVAKLAPQLQRPIGF